MTLETTLRIRDKIHKLRAQNLEALSQEITRLVEIAPTLGIQRMVLFGSAARGDSSLTSDLDLIIVWDTPLDIVSRTVELYRRLEPKAPVDLLVYTPEEMQIMAKKPFIKKALKEGKVLYENG